MPPIDDHQMPFGGRGWWGVFALFAALAFVCWLVLGASTTFRVDDWHLILNRSLADPVGLLAQFNEQLIVLPAAIFRAIFAIVGLHSYLPYVAVLLALHVVAAAALARLVRDAAGPAAGLAAGIVMLFLGSGSENLNSAFQIGQVLATAAGIAAIDAMVLRRRPGLAAALLVVSIASHAIGAAFLAGCVVAAVLDRTPRSGWLALPLAVGLGWVLLFDAGALSNHHEGASTAIAALPAFIAVGPIAAVASLYGANLVGGFVALIGAAIYVLATRRRPAVPALVAGAGVALLAEYGLIALTRAGFGVEATTWPRYVYSAAPLVLALAAGWIGRRERIRTWSLDLPLVALFVMTFVSVAGNVRIYLKSVPITMDEVDQVRAAMVIAEWAPDSARLPLEPFLPDAVGLRGLPDGNGSPVRDDLMPEVVPPLGAEAVREACLALIGEAEVDGCLARVRATLPVE